MTPDLLGFESISMLGLESRIRSFWPLWVPGIVGRDSVLPLPPGILFEDADRFLSVLIDENCLGSLLFSYVSTELLDLSITGMEL